MFGANANNHQTIEFYFNNIDLIKQFTRYFHFTATDLVTKANNNRINVPKKFQPSYKDALEQAQAVYKNKQQLPAIFPEVTKALHINGQIVKLTAREVDCIRLTLKGFTAKMIGNYLRLSRRTIEQYLERIKIKLNCRSREELIYSLLDLPYTIN